MCDDVAAEEKVDCGVDGTTRDECIDTFKCCWYTKVHHGTPYCYRESIDLHVNFDKHFCVYR